MGVQLTELLKLKEVNLNELVGKVFAVDSHLFLYQFLTTIRQRDGSLLMDSKGRVTSHLTGLFSRTTKLMESGLKLVYVFDGEAPKLKHAERERRKEMKIKAQEKYEEAKKKEDLEEMKKYAARTTRLTPEMIKEAKNILEALGIPIIEAPSEGEAQAAYLVKNGNAFAVASQDADSLLFGAPTLVRNLSVVGKRKRANKAVYDTFKPEIIDLAENLNNLGIDQDQLIVLGMLIGTDYNYGGVKGIGPKSALKLLKQHGKNFDKMFKEVKWADYCNVSWKEVFEVFKKIPVTDKFKLEWKGVDKEKIIKILVDDHDFSQERVEKGVERLLRENEKKTQKGLGDFF